MLFCKWHTQFEALKERWLLDFKCNLKFHLSHVSQCRHHLLQHFHLFTDCSRRRSYWDLMSKSDTAKVGEDKPHSQETRHWDPHHKGSYWAQATTTDLSLQYQLRTTMKHMDNLILGSLKCVFKKDFLLPRNSWMYKFRYKIRCFIYDCPCDLGMFSRAVWFASYELAQEKESSL